ncbi:MAG: 16S rRNA (adenine(1518)-N(6)/adenine(1519)-N(6))-dimethyltransferase RsmA [Aureispira sp.]|nr:16S rRNA (adenine(1518)-N(6)/adenine(1519)-N(6))-dimethyltransferase RsmA [Aureispira sp.]
MVKPKKSYGQHFLKEESIAQRIAQSLTQMDLYQNILEVGPGMGMLTKYLMEYPEHSLKVVEADTDMVTYLTENYAELTPNIISADFLKVNLHEHFDAPFALIGNFPYNISSQILFKLLDYKEQIPEMVGMFQKEVAERVAAKPKTSAYGILSVLLQAFYETKYLFTVKPGSFNPPPKVMSGVIQLTRKENFEDLGCNPKLFKSIVKASFGMRRKMLRNSLKPFIKKNVILQHDIFKKRPQDLTVQEFVAITNLA